MQLHALIGCAALAVTATATHGELQTHDITPTQSGWNDPCSIDELLNVLDEWGSDC